MRKLQNVYEVTVLYGNTNKKYNVIGTNVSEAISNLLWRGKPYDYSDEDENHQQANKEWEEYVGQAQGIKCILRDVIV